MKLATFSIAALLIATGGADARCYSWSGSCDQSDSGRYGSGTGESGYTQHYNQDRRQTNPGTNDYLFTTPSRTSSWSDGNDDRSRDRDRDYGSTVGQFSDGSAQCVVGLGGRMRCRR